MDTWEAVLELVSAQLPQEEAEPILKALKDVSLNKPSEIEGLSQTDFDEIGSKVTYFPQRALLKRTLKAAEHQLDAKSLSLSLA